MASISDFEATCTAGLKNVKINSRFIKFTTSSTHHECILYNCWTPSVTDLLSFVVIGSCWGVHRRYRQPFDRPSPNFVKSTKKKIILFTFVFLQVFEKSQVRVFKIIADHSNKSLWRFAFFQLRHVGEQTRLHRHLMRLCVGVCGLPLVLLWFAYKLINAMSRYQLGVLTVQISFVDVIKKHKLRNFLLACKTHKNSICHLSWRFNFLFLFILFLFTR